MVRVRIYQASAFAVGVTVAILAGSAAWMAAGLLATTLLALALAWRQTLDLVVIEDCVGALREGGLPIPREGDDVGADPASGGDEGVQLVCFAGV